MFFPELIKSIKSSDRVLEVGPGGEPHPRSDVFLEYEFESQAQAESQRAYAAPLKTKKPIVFYKGEVFPFKDKEFDYVICSHVAEHVENLDKFIAEVTRVGKAGYLEYPTIYYDYLYNIPNHITFVKRKNQTLYWMSKNQSKLSEFQLVQNLLYESLSQRHFDLIDNLRPFFFEGFEWVDSVKTNETEELKDLIFDKASIPVRKKNLPERIQNFSFSRIFEKFQKRFFM
jgi:ubiquinone/menaquinone biosynthesis C-methylase UbiE